MGGSASEDEALLAALRAGDQQTFARLVQEWSGLMLRIAGVHVGDHATAEDVVQETWIAVLRGLDRFRGESSLRTWVFRILVNRAKTSARQPRALPLPSLDWEAGPTVSPDRFQGAGERWPGHWRTPPDPWPEEALLTAETHERVMAAIAALPPRQRAVISLRDVHGWGPSEVCAVLDLTEGNQRVLLHRARAAVRAALARALTAQDIS